MTLRVFTKADKEILSQSKAAAPPDSGLVEKVTNHIPVIIVTVWTAAVSPLNSLNSELVYWIFFIALLILIYPCMKQLTDQPKLPIANRQIFASMGAFVCWVLALGGPFSYIPGFNPIYGTLALLFYVAFLFALLGGD
jgi:hypothetical protein